MLHIRHVGQAGSDLGRRPTLPEGEAQGANAWIKQLGGGTVYVATGYEGAAVGEQGRRAAVATSTYAGVSRPASHC